MRLNTFFYLSHLIFGNSNSAASSTMHGETYGGGRVVPSLMVAGNRVCVHVFFNSGNIAAASTEHGREPQWTRAMVLPCWIGN